MKKKTQGWLGAAALVLFVGAGGTITLPGSDSTPDPTGPSSPASPSSSASPGGAKGQLTVTGRLYQIDHWWISLSDDSELELTDPEGENCPKGAAFPACKKG